MTLGTFDTVRFVCPTCGSFITVQSKSGPCSMRTYDAPQDHIPEEILDSLKRENPYYVCGSCRQEFALEVLPIVRVVKTLALYPLEEGQTEFFSRRGATLTYDPERKFKGTYVDPIWPHEMEREYTLDDYSDAATAEVVRMLDRMDAESLKSEAMAHFNKEITE